MSTLKSSRTWEYEDKFVVCEGLLQLWWNPKTCDRKDFGKDPPVLRPEVTDWLTAHPEVSYVVEPLVGPPYWEFPSGELRQEFMDRFLETPERMEEIIRSGVEAKSAERYKTWLKLGKPMYELGDRMCPGVPAEDGEGWFMGRMSWLEESNDQEES
jgi:hypothetical protein